MTGTERRFWAKVKKTRRCWEWTASQNPDGYGQFRYGDRPLLAHRVSWLLTHGTLPDDYFILHRCDNRLCVRPDHLFVGDHAANMADMSAKGRHGRPHRNKPACPRGHPYRGRNLIVDRRGWRKCRKCEEARSLGRSATHYRPQGFGARGARYAAVAD